MSNHSLTYYDVVKEILSRVNDPEGDTYLARAKELAYEGICAMVLSDYPREGFPSLYKSESVAVSDDISTDYRVLVSGSERELGSDMLKVVTITDDYEYPEADSTITEHKYIKISTDRYNRLNDAEEKPFEDEIYYYHQGDYIYFYPYADMVNQNILIHYIASPDEYVWSSDGTTDGTGSTIMTEKFSLDFLYKVIDYSMGKIKQEQSGE